MGAQKTENNGATTDHGQVNELKKELLKAVANGASTEIFRCAKDLEALNLTDASVGGRWSLVSWWHEMQPVGRSSNLGVESL